MKSLENNNFLTLQSDFKSVYIDKNVSVEKTCNPGFWPEQKN